MRQNEMWLEDGLRQNKNAPMKRCYETHPPLKLRDGLVIYGGSCGYPIVTDADVYIGLDYSIQKSKLSYPWEKGESFLYPITDMQAPSDPVSFIKLIDWTIEQLEAKKKVHVGCIGGHGRTGTVFAALVAVMMDRKDAIEYVREAYCRKAVESKTQVEFLMKHFGVEKAPGAKEISYPPREPVTTDKGAKGAQMLTKKKPIGKDANYKNGYGQLKGADAPVADISQRKSLPATSYLIAPGKSPMNIWGKNVVFNGRSDQANIGAANCTSSVQGGT